MGGDACTPVAAGLFLTLRVRPLAVLSTASPQPLSHRGVLNRAVAGYYRTRFVNRAPLP